MQRNWLQFTIAFIGYVIYFLFCGMWKLSKQLACGNVARGELLGLLLKAPRNNDSGSFQPRKSSHFRKHRHRGGRRHRGGNHNNNRH